MTGSTDKRCTIGELVGSLSRDRTVAFGGGGLQRKPMLAATAIGRSALSDLHVITFLGGPEVDLLIGLGKVRRIEFAFVGFDGCGLAPHFRSARENGALEAVEYTEGLMMTAFEAAAKELPFLPSRFGLGTDVLTTPTSVLTTFACPLTGELLVAVPALSPDVAVVHVNEADVRGNAVIHGDAFADLLLVQAAKRVFLTAERIVDDLGGDYPGRSAFLSRLWVDGVIEAPGGGGVTAVYPDYRFDLPRILDYQARAAATESLRSFMVDVT